MELCGNKKGLHKCTAALTPRQVILQHLLMCHSHLCACGEEGVVFFFFFGSSFTKIQFVYYTIPLFTVTF